MSLGIIVTRFAWIAHKLVSSNRETRKASEATCTTKREKNHKTYEKKMIKKWVPVELPMMLIGNDNLLWVHDKFPVLIFEMGLCWLVAALCFGSDECLWEQTFQVDIDDPGV